MIKFLRVMMLTKIQKKDIRQANILFLIFYIKPILMLLLPLFLQKRKPLSNQSPTIYGPHTIRLTQTNQSMKESSALDTVPNRIYQDGHHDGAFALYYKEEDI